MRKSHDIFPWIVQSYMVEPQTIINADGDDNNVADDWITTC